MVAEFNPIDPWSHEFLKELVREFGPELDVVRVDRERRNGAIGGPLPGLMFTQEPAEVIDKTWRCAPPPRDLLDRRVEITGPGVDAKMVLNALNSGASGYMVDGEDSLSPTWQNVVATQRNMYYAVRRFLRVGDKELVANPAVLHYRPRGLHMVESNFEVDGKPAPAVLVDFGLFAYWNAFELLRRGSGPYVYLPKLETEGEAAWWCRVMTWTEQRLHVPSGSFRCTVLVETLPGLLRLEPIVWALRGRLVGLNVGRWDYIFSCLKTMAFDPDYALPDRSAITMDTPALAEYARWVVNVAHRRGVHAIGGMAAHVPSRRDPVATAAAVEAVRADKRREVLMGHDGTWVAHPDLVPVAMEVFATSLGERVEQRHVVPGDAVLDRSVALGSIRGSVSEAGIREAARTLLQYVDAWLDGSGCVAIDGKMEDAATAEISRALLWHWVKRGVMSKGDVANVLRGEGAALAAAVGAEPKRTTMRLVLESTLSNRLPEFFTSSAYEALLERRPAKRI